MNILSGVSINSTKSTFNVVSETAEIMLQRLSNNLNIPVEELIQKLSIQSVERPAPSVDADKSEIKKKKSEKAEKKAKKNPDEKKEFKSENCRAAVKGGEQCSRKFKDGKTFCGGHEDEDKRKHGTYDDNGNFIAPPKSDKIVMKEEKEEKKPEENNEEKEKQQEKDEPEVEDDDEEDPPIKIYNAPNGKKYYLNTDTNIVYKYITPVNGAIDFDDLEEIGKLVDDQIIVV